MSDPSRPARLYGDKEIGRILERATELQRAEPTSASGGGMTLSELEDIAREAGIDVHHLRRAALEVDTGAGTPTPWSRFLGEDLTVTCETVLPGEVPEGSFEELLAVIQSAVREHGQPSLLGRTLTWQGGGVESARRLRILVSSRDAETTVRIEENLSQTAGGLFGGIGGGVGGGVGLGVGLSFGLSVGSPLLAVALPVAACGVAYGMARGIYTRVVRGRRRVLEELFGQLVETATAAIAEQTLEGG